MTRKQRVHYNGAVYHVAARGNNRQVIFKDEFDKMYYLSLLCHYKEKFECKLYAYVLMDNHVHLLIKVAELYGVRPCDLRPCDLRFVKVLYGIISDV